MNATQAATMLKERAAEYVTHLLPNVVIRGSEAYVGSLGGEEGKSLKICVSGKNVGRWSEFAGVEQGDLIGLTIHVKKYTVFQAVEEAQKFLGVSNVSSIAQPKKIYVRPRKNSDLKPLIDHVEGFKYLHDVRGISTDTINQFEILCTDKAIAFPYYRNLELINRKYRSITEKKFWTEAEAEPCLFGWDQLTGLEREIIICEGEIDALTWFDYGFKALSIPYGAGHGSTNDWIDNDWDLLEVYDKIYLSMDPDRAGQNAVNDLVQRLGRERTYVVTLPYHDANECKLKGVDDLEMKRRLDQAQTIDPQEVRLSGTFIEDVLRIRNPASPQEAGVTLPWVKTHDSFRLRRHELTIWGGFNGSGKSMTLNQIMLHAINQGERCCIASMEMRPALTLNRIYNQAVAGRNLTDDQIRTMAEYYSERILIFNVLGTAKIDVLMEAAKYARRRYGVTQFVIDSLMKCGINEEDYNQQKVFVDTLANFTNHNDLHIHLVAHSRKERSEDVEPGKLSIRGSGTITDLADNVFTIWRNKPKEDAIREKTGGRCLSQPDVYIRCHKQRNGDWEGAWGLYRDAVSHHLLEREGDMPKDYFTFDSEVQM